MQNNEKEVNTITQQKIRISTRVNTFLLISSVFAFGAVAALAFVIPNKEVQKTVIKEESRQLEVEENIDIQTLENPTLITATVQEAIDLKSSSPSVQPLVTPVIEAFADSETPTQGRIIYVDNSAGSSNPDGTSWETAYLNLNDALEDLSNEYGATVLIAEGNDIYYEDFSTGPDNYGCAIGNDDNGLNAENMNIIKAKPGDNPIFKCIEANGFEFYLAQWIKIRGLTFLSADVGNRNGFNIRNSSNVEFINNTIADPHSNGLTLGFSDHVQVKDNIINNALNSITLWDSDNNTIEGNVIKQSDCTGIKLDNGSENNQLHHNLVYSSGVNCIIFGYSVGGNGIRIQGNSNNNTLFSNTIDDSIDGGWLYQGQWYDTNGRGILVYGNSIENDLENSIISNSGLYGVDIEGGSSLTATYNNIWNVGGVAGEGNISSNPNYILSQSGNYHLRCYSPSVDSGDPVSDYSQEPEPNGGRINQGTYGNTPEAVITDDINCGIPMRR